jgi:hypothetical protein
MLYMSNFPGFSHRKPEIGICSRRESGFKRKYGIIQRITEYRYPLTKTYMYSFMEQHNVGIVGAQLQNQMAQGSIVMIITPPCNGAF